MTVGIYHVRNATFKGDPANNGEYFVEFAGIDTLGKPWFRVTIPTGTIGEHMAMYSARELAREVHHGRVVLWSEWAVEDGQVVAL